MKKHAAPTKPQPQQMAPPPHAQKQRQTPKAREEKRQFRSFDDFCQDEDNETNTRNGAGADDLLGPGKYPNPYAQAPVQASSSTRTFAKPAATPSFQGAVPDFMGLGSQVMSQAEMDSRGVLQRGGFFPPPPPPPPPAKHHQNALPRKNQGPKTHGKKK